jgi:hypothetical protein
MNIPDAINLILKANFCSIEEFNKTDQALIRKGVDKWLSEPVDYARSLSSRKSQEKKVIEKMGHFGTYTCPHTKPILFAILGVNDIPDRIDRIKVKRDNIILEEDYQNIKIIKDLNQDEIQLNFKIPSEAVLTPIQLQKICLHEGINDKIQYGRNFKRKTTLKLNPTQGRADKDTFNQLYASKNKISTIYATGLEIKLGKERQIKITNSFGFETYKKLIQYL